MVIGGNQVYCKHTIPSIVCEAFYHHVIMSTNTRKVVVKLGC